MAGNFDELKREIAAFTQTLWAVLAVLGLGLLAAILVQVRYGLRPLRRLQDELAAIRSGAQERLAGRYPVEIEPVSTELNCCSGEPLRIASGTRSCLEWSRRSSTRTCTRHGNWSAARKASTLGQHRPQPPLKAAISRFSLFDIFASHEEGELLLAAEQREVLLDPAQLIAALAPMTEKRATPDSLRAMLASWPGRSRFSSSYFETSSNRAARPWLRPANTIPTAAV